MEPNRPGARLKRCSGRPCSPRGHGVGTVPCANLGDASCVYTVVDAEEPGSRDIDAIDRELTLLALVRATVQEGGGKPLLRVDELLDERLAHRGRASKDPAIDA